MPGGVEFSRNHNQRIDNSTTSKSSTKVSEQKNTSHQVIKITTPKQPSHHNHQTTPPQNRRITKIARVYKITTPPNHRIRITKNPQMSPKITKKTRIIKFPKSQLFKNHQNRQNLQKSPNHENLNDLKTTKTIQTKNLQYLQVGYDRRGPRLQEVHEAE